MFCVPLLIKLVACTPPPPSPSPSPQKADAHSGSVSVTQRQSGQSSEEEEAEDEDKHLFTTPWEVLQRLGGPTSLTPRLCDYTTTPDYKSGLTQYEHSIQLCVYVLYPNQAIYNITVSVTALCKVLACIALYT